MRDLAMGEAIHLTGTIPGDNAEQAIKLALKEGAEHLLWLPDGETGERRNWLVNTLDALKDHPDLEVIKPGTFKDYSDFTCYDVKKGHSFSSSAIPLKYHDYAAESWPIFADLREQYHRPDLAFQIGIPGTLQLPTFAFQSKVKALRYRKQFAARTAQEIDDICNNPDIGGSGSENIVFQLEVPTEVHGMAGDFSLPGLRQFGARFFADGIVKQAKMAQQNTRFGIHLCFGDLNNKAITRPDTLEPVVALANAIARQWPQGRALEYMHLPFAFGDEAPLRNISFYHPLSQLKLPNQTRLIAGFVHEKQDLDTQWWVRDTIEKESGRRVDISQSCGIARGKRTPEIARLLIQKAVQLTQKKRY